MPPTSQVPVAFRNATLGPIHAPGPTRIAATCRAFMARPPAAPCAIGLLHNLET